MRKWREIFVSQGTEREYGGNKAAINGTEAIRGEGWMHPQGPQPKFTELLECARAQSSCTLRTRHYTLGHVLRRGRRGCCNMVQSQRRRGGFTHRCLVPSPWLSVRVYIPTCAVDP